MKIRQPAIKPGLNRGNPASVMRHGCCDVIKIVLPEKEEGLMGRFARKQTVNLSRERSTDGIAHASFTERTPVINAWGSRRSSSSSRAKSPRENIIKFDNSSGSNRFSRFIKDRLALSGRRRKVARLAMVAALAIAGLMIGWSMGGALTDPPVASASKNPAAQTLTSAAPVVEQSSAISADQPDAPVVEQEVTEQPSAGVESKVRRGSKARQRGNYAGNGFNPTVIVTKPAKVIKKANPLKIGRIF